MTTSCCFEVAPEDDKCKRGGRYYRNADTDRSNAGSDIAAAGPDIAAADSDIPAADCDIPDADADLAAATPTQIAAPPMIRRMAPIISTVFRTFHSAAPRCDFSRRRNLRRRQSFDRQQQLIRR